MNNLKFNIVVITLLCVSILCNIFTFTYYNSKLNKIDIESTIEECLTAISSSDDTIEIHYFFKTQLEKKLISENELSQNYQELININEKLINSLSLKTNEKTNSLVEQTIFLLNDRKKALENFKVAIDLNSSNYNNVAENLLISANQKKEEIQILLSQY